MKKEIQSEREKQQELVARGKQRESSEKELEQLRDKMSTVDAEKEELKVNDDSKGLCDFVHAQP